MTNYVEFVEWNEIPIPFVPKLFDRPRWWLVRLLGGTCPFDSVKLVRVPINDKDFMTRLWRQRRELVESFRREPTTLLIGGEDYQELMDSPQFKTAISFQARFNYERHEIYGLTVKVIPWMRGILVMPTRIAENL